MSKSDEALKEKVLNDRREGKVTMWLLPGELGTMPVEEFVKQPADGILYDLNRLEENALSDVGNIRWVNDFAVAVTIRKLVEQRDELQKKLNDGLYVNSSSSEAVELIREMRGAGDLGYHGRQHRPDCAECLLMERVDAFLAQFISARSITTKETGK